MNVIVSWKKQTHPYLNVVQKKNSYVFLKRTVLVSSNAYLKLHSYVLKLMNNIDRDIVTNLRHVLT